MSSLDNIVLNSETQDEFIKQLMSSLVSATKGSNTVPKGLDFEYLNSFPEYREKSQETINQAQQLLISALSYCSNDGSGKNVPSIRMSDEILEPYFYEQIAETIDSLIDDATSTLNSIMNLNKNLSSETFVATTQQAVYLNKERIVQENVKDLKKPQLNFFQEIDNSRSTPFKPKLRNKYHKKIEYDGKERLFTSVDNESSFTGYYPHPYEQELLTMEFPNWMLVAPAEEIVFPDPHRPFQFVETSNQLNKIIEELKRERIIALDLEHHSYRSFLGLTCLMQISSSSKDYVIDTLALRLDCEKLGVIFADPKILKVFHGCEQDIFWLQRDLGLYVVNCFDTFLASKELQFPAFSLSHLVTYYCHVELDKKHQLSDWRQRPLPEEMISYAKLDTHYLLFIYHSLVHDIWQSSGGGIESIEKVLFGSRKLCLQRYEKPIFDPLGYQKLFQRQFQSKYIPKLSELSVLQQTALSLLWNWRDEQARREDESVDSIMSNAEFLRLGVKIPQTNEQIEACGPLSSFVQSHRFAVLKVLLEVTNMNPSQYLQSQTQLKNLSELQQQKHRFEEEMKFNSVFTIVPRIPNQILQQQQIVSENRENVRQSKEDFFKTAALSTDEIFKMAKWESSDSMLSVTSSAPNKLPSLNFDTNTSNTIFSEEIQQKMRKSIDDLNQFIQNDAQFENYLRSLVRDDSSSHNNSNNNGNASSATVSHNPILHVIKHSKDDFLIDGNDDVIQEIPHSYDEIYILASRNRKKNKDKKRKDRGGDVDSSLETADVLYSLNKIIENNDAGDLSPSSSKQETDDFNVDDYFKVEGVNVDSSVEATLNYAREVGWVNSEKEMNEIRDEHSRILAYQQSADDPSVGGGSANEDGGKQYRGQHDHIKTGHSPNRSDKVKAGKDTRFQNIQNSSKSTSSKVSTSNKPVNKPSPTPFDYSKMTSSSLIGALPSGTGSEGEKKSSNPYGLGSGSGGRGKPQSGRGGGPNPNPNTSRTKSNLYFSSNNLGSSNRYSK